MQEERMCMSQTAGLLQCPAFRRMGSSSKTRYTRAFVLFERCGW
jgi:hypothetical protein